jgi:1-acyl-sn-glycerol-3-phosphate acyltransferase
MEIKELKTGAARIAAAAGVPLLPLVLWGTQRLMTKDHDKDFSRGTDITVSVGAPVPLTGEAVADTDALKAAMSGLLDDAIRSYPQPDPGAWWLPASHGGSAPTLGEAARLDAEEKATRAARKATKSA